MKGRRRGEKRILWRASYCSKQCIKGTPKVVEGRGGEEERGRGGEGERGRERGGEEERGRGGEGERGRGGKGERGRGDILFFL